MRECIFVVGTRAQLVKLAPVLCQASKSGLQHVVWFTGQHNESIDDLIDDFDIRSEFISPQQQTERSSVFRLVTWLPGTLLGCLNFVRSVRKRTQSAPLVWCTAIPCRPGSVPSQADWRPNTVLRCQITAVLLMFFVIMRQ